MNSEKNEISADDDNGRALRIREAAAFALKELDQLRSGGPVTQEALAAEVARPAQERLHPHGCDLVVDRRGDNLTRLLIGIRRTQLEVPSPQPPKASSHVSLWRETMAQKSYW